MSYVNCHGPASEDLISHHDPCFPVLVQRGAVYHCNVIQDHYVCWTMWEGICKYLFFTTLGDRCCHYCFRVVKNKSGQLSGIIC